MYVWPPAVRFLFYDGAEDPARSAAVAAMLAVPGVKRVLATDRAAFLAAFPFFAGAAGTAARLGGAAESG